MTRLGSFAALIVCVSLAAPTAALAQPVIRGDVQIHVDLPKVIIRDRTRTPPRAYVRFDDYRDYDRVDRVRPTFDITGTYDSQYGRVYLLQDGNRVTGTFEAGVGGVIKGRIRGNQLVYRWKNTDAEGRGVWFLNRRNNTVEGTWGTFNSTNNAGKWDLQRVGVSYRDRPNRPNRPYRRY